MMILEALIYRRWINFGVELNQNRIYVLGAVILR